MASADREARVVRLPRMAIWVAVASSPTPGAGLGSRARVKASANAHPRGFALEADREVSHRSPPSARIGGPRPARSSRPNRPR